MCCPSRCLLLPGHAGHSIGLWWPQFLLLLGGAEVRGGSWNLRQQCRHVLPGPASQGEASFNSGPESRHTSHWALRLLGMKDGALVEVKGWERRALTHVPWPVYRPDAGTASRTAWLHHRDYLFIKSPGHFRCHFCHLEKPPGLAIWKIFSTSCLSWMYKGIGIILLL